MTDKLRKYLEGMSQREQRLALAVAALLSLMLCVSVVRGAFAYVDHLDKSIDRLQEDIVNFKYQIAHRQEVEAMYARVAKQHSSKWSEAEIHDRLRQEIYRLAQMTPPPLDENGIPVQINTKGGTLVDIPTLRQGVMLEGGEDFREYQLGFRIDRAEFSNVTAFVERLQNSPQSLRIDDFIIARSPASSEVSARMEITRTVVSGESEVSGADAESTWTLGKDAAPLSPESWKSEQCALNPNMEFAFHDEAALEALSSAAGAAVYYERDMDTGFSYDMYVEVAAFADCQLAVSDLLGKAPFKAPYALPNDGQPYRYHVRFSVPGDVGGTLTLRVPTINFNEADGKAVISSLVIKKAVG